MDALVLFHTLGPSLAVSDSLGPSLIPFFLGCLLLFWWSYISLFSDKYISGEIKTLPEYSWEFLIYLINYLICIQFYEEKVHL